MTAGVAISQPTRTRTRTRALVLSLRHLEPTPSRAAAYELEDVLREVDDVSLVVPQQSQRQVALSGRLAGRLQRALRWVATPRVGGGPATHDLLFLSIESPRGLLHLDPAGLRQQLRRAGTSACYVDELWAWTIPHRPGEMQLLSNFDHLFVGCAGAVGALAQATGRPTHYLPPAVDALRFCPWPDPPPRSIDVHSLGRRAPTTHLALLQAAEERDWFYLHASLLGRRVVDPREHRLLLARLLRRSRFLLAYPAKVDRPEETRGQSELGFRYFEGAAAGAVLLGTLPDTPHSAEHFGWEDAVIPLPYGDRRPQAAIDAFAADPERLARASARNALESLRRHDWSHRWERILEVVGLPASDGLRARRQRLERRAALVARAADL